MAKKKTKKKQKQKVSTVLICVIATAVLVLTLAAVWFFLLGPGQSLFVFDQATLAGVNLAGMTKEEAREALAETAKKYAAEDMCITVGDTTIRLSPQTTGCQLDVEKAVDAAFGSDNNADFDLTPYLNLNTEVIQQVVDGIGEEYDLEYSDSSVSLEETGNGQVLCLNPGSPERILDSEKLYSDIMNAYRLGIFQVEAEFSTREPESIDLDALYEEYNTSAVDAYWDTESHEMVDGVDGQGFDLEEARALLAEAAPGETVKITLTAIPPEVTADKLWETMFEDVLSTCSTPYTSNEYRDNNLRLACEAVNGTILYPGDTFSFNETLGERTAEKGYLPGASYEGGKVVYTYGGGICQVSSTLYYCTLIADLEIVERYCHMYPADYIEYGMDATVSWGTLDYQFRNNTDYPIYISADSSGGYVTVTFTGTDTRDYYVDMEYEIVAVYDYDTVYEEYAPDNEEGYYDGQTITWPVIGYGVDTYRCRYDKETDELLSRDYEDYSDYDHRDAVICKIVYPEEETEPTETDPYYEGSGNVSPEG